jgi:hypothetical protein
MSRTTYYKGIYFAIVIGGAALFCFWRWHSKPQGIVLAGVILLLLLPGRILGFFWRDLLRGLRLLGARDFEASKRHSAAFLVQVRAKPWLRKLIWLGTSSYSRDPEALALNNLGAAEIGLGNHAAAREHLEASIAVDPLNPLPYWNLAVLSRVLQDEAAAEHWAAEARRLGYSGGISDALVMNSQQGLAKTSG